MAKKLNGALRSERATEGVQIGSGGEFKINWMWGLRWIKDFQVIAFYFGPHSSCKACMIKQ